MFKTSVYLTAEEAAALRRAAAATGRSQADLIREGVRRVVADAPPRTFRSRGLGEGPAYAPPDPAELEQRLTGRGPAP